MPKPTSKPDPERGLTCLILFEDLSPAATKKCISSDKPEISVTYQNYFLFLISSPAKKSFIKIPSISICYRQISNERLFHISGIFTGE